MKLTQFRRRQVLPTAAAIVTVVAGAVAVLVNKGAFEGIAPTPIINLITLIAGFFGLTVYLGSALWSRQVDRVALSRLTESIKNVADSGDYSRSIGRVGEEGLDELTAQVNRLIGAVMRGNETIDQHEFMERNLSEWLRKRSIHERELKEARLAADIANRTKSLFLASVSHELRTPLHTIMNYARFGMEDAEKGRLDDLRDFMEVIHDSGDLLLLLVNDLLDLSKLELGRMSFKMVTTSLADVVGCGLDEFQVTLQNSNHTVVTDFKKPDRVLIDTARTGQVVRNLLENVIKYTPRDSSIFVTVSESDGNVTLCVRDQGRGVPDDELDIIFESFRQSSNARVGDVGVGLGLAIARQLVTAQKGRMWAENHAEGGLAVFVQFALSDAPSSSGDSDSTIHQESLVST